MSLGRAAVPIGRHALFALAWSLTTWSGLALAQAEPQSGGALVVALARQEECIDPQQSNYGYGSNEGRQLVDSLTEQSYDRPTEIVPWLATSWDVNQDATRYTFRLRPDVTFSDGSKLDAALVKDNFDRLAKIPRRRRRRLSEGDRRHCRAGSAHRADQLRAAERPLPAGHLDRRTRHRRPRDARQDPGCALRRRRHRLRAVHHREGGLQSETILAKRPDYNWPSKLRTHGGPAYLDKVVYKMVPEASVRTGALKSRQADVIQNVSVQDAAALEKAGYPITGVNSLGMAVNLVINVSRPVLADRAVRLALRQGINRKEVADIAFNGYQPAATGILTPQAPIISI